MILDPKTVEGIGDITCEEDEHVTSVGKILRISNLDELPQFINVQKGEMSVLGPRPRMVSEDYEVQKRVNKYLMRY